MHQKAKVFSLLIAILFMAGTIFSAPETVKYPDTAAGKRLKELVQKLNRGKPETWKLFFKENYSDKFLNRFPMERHNQMFEHIHQDYKQIELKKVVESSDYSAKGLFFSKKNETWLRIGIKVSKDAPHKIDGIGIRPGSPPLDKKNIKKKSAADAFKELDSYVQKKVKEEKFSGTVLVAKENPVNGQPGHQVLFKKAYGQASKRFEVDNRIDTKFNLGSMNKMFTAVAVAQLVEKGKLAYNQKISRYLDESWVKKEFAEKIQVQHLLCHTSGLGSYFKEEFFNASRLKFRQLEDYKPIVKDDKLRFEPGTRWGYSNSGMFLLGLIIEKVSGMNYFDYIRENISKPADMINSDCYDMDRPVKNLAIGYFKDEKNDGWRNNTFMHVVRGGPAGGGYSTVEDLLNFALALRGNKLISAKSRVLLTSVKPELGSPDYGFGFTVQKVGDDTIYGHSGGFLGIQAILQVYKKSGYIFAILSNTSGGMQLIKPKIESLIRSIK